MAWQQLQDPNYPNQVAEMRARIEAKNIDFR